MAKGPKIRVEARIRPAKSSLISVILTTLEGEEILVLTEGGLSEPEVESRVNARDLVFPPVLLGFLSNSVASLAEPKSIEYNRSRIRLMREYLRAMELYEVHVVYL